VWTLAAGESVELDALWLAFSLTPPLGALERFADAMGEAHAVTVPTPTSGWGSWGHWLERIDAGLMRETVLALEGARACATRFGSYRSTTAGRSCSRRTGYARRGARTGASPRVSRRSPRRSSARAAHAGCGCCLSA
jgi:hypothetical protein